MPNILARIASNFLEGRSAYAQVNSARGTVFELSTGVPQGSCLSPTLFVLSTADTPPPNPRDGATHLAYADDHTQLVLCPFPSRAAQCRRMERSITTRNQYERDRKIVNHIDKMNIVAASRRIPPGPLVVEGEELECSQNANFLGLRMTQYGFRRQVVHNKGKANRQLQKLKRFTMLPTSIKIRLYKSLVMPMLTYPAVPLNVASRSSHLELQRVQNKALRWIHSDGTPRDPDEHPNQGITTAQLHALYRMEPLNQRISQTGQEGVGIPGTGPELGPDPGLRRGNRGRRLPGPSVLASQ